MSYNWPPPIPPPSRTLPPAVITFWAEIEMSNSNFAQSNNGNFALNRACRLELETILTDRVQMRQAHSRITCLSTKLPSRVASKMKDT